MLARSLFRHPHDSGVRELEAIYSVKQNSIELQFSGYDNSDAKLLARFILINVHVLELMRFIRYSRSDDDVCINGEAGLQISKGNCASTIELLKALGFPSHQTRVSFPKDPPDESCMYI